MSEEEKLGLPLRAIDLPIAAELAETLLIQSDLRNCFASLEIWAKTFAPTQAQNEETKVILGSLFRDAIVQFVGCFEKTRHPLKVDEIYAKVEGSTAYYKWLHDLRNSFAAHRYGVGRQCVVGVFVHPELGYQAPGQIVGIYKGPHPSGHRTLLNFVFRALKFANAKVERLTAEFDAQARAIPLDQLLKAPVAMVHNVEAKKMGMSRGRLKKDRQDQS